VFSKDVGNVNLCLQTMMQQGVSANANQGILKADLSVQKRL